MKETYVKPELVREVKMGPFTHKVDDGIDTRKVGTFLFLACLSLPADCVPERLRDSLRSDGERLFTCRLDRIF